MAELRLGLKTETIYASYPILFDSGPSRLYIPGGLARWPNLFSPAEAGSDLLGGREIDCDMI